MDKLIRTEMLIGREGVSRLSSARVAVFGIGGVGGYVVEALARSGIGAIDLVDSDTVAESNLNRQIIATRDTLGMLKVDAAEARIRSIDPDIKVRKYPIFYLPKTADAFDFSSYDYVVDAIDTVSGKLEIIKRANEAGVPVISCMGTGNKLDPTALEVADIYKTSVCPLAKVMRSLCRKNGIKALKVVYSREEPIKPEQTDETQTKGEVGRPAPASCAFVPSVAGLIIAGEVVKDIACV